jgi:hypothetical protein
VPAGTFGHNVARAPLLCPDLGFNEGVGLFQALMLTVATILVTAVVVGAGLMAMARLEAGDHRGHRRPH